MTYLLSSFNGGQFTYRWDSRRATYFVTFVWEDLAFDRQTIVYTFLGVCCKLPKISCRYRYAFWRSLQKTRWINVFLAPNEFILYRLGPISCSRIPCDALAVTKAVCGRRVPGVTKKHTFHELSNDSAFLSCRQMMDSFSSMELCIVICPCD